jgi:tetratricopeptide (TPR) repeat protein
MPSFLDKLFKRQAGTPPPTGPTSASPADSRPFGITYEQATQAATAGESQRAIRLFDEAIALDPTRAEPYYKRANLLKDLGHLEAAVASYDQAIERKPDYVYAYCNRGSVQHRLGTLGAALSSYDQALAIDAGDAFTHYNRALLLQDLFRWEDAVAGYARAIEINPNFADAQYNRAVALLFLGDFPNGWPAYEWRWKNAQRLGIGAAREFAQPMWSGKEPLMGARLLLHSEAGLGDTIQFCRYAKLISALGAVVFLEAQEPLVQLLGSLEGVAQVLPKGGTFPSFDYHSPLMSLPAAFRTTLETIPAFQKYLRADPFKVAQWHALLGEKTRPRIGLIWSGNPNNPIDARRSVRLADWVPHLPPEFHYFRLQTQVRDADRDVLDSSEVIFSFDDELLDFPGTAALCACLDLIISVDTSIAHLSGALGRRTWVLLPYTPDWRWLRDRSDSPWYPTMKLYRQEAVGDWESLLGRLAADLRREISSSPALR